MAKTTPPSNPRSGQRAAKKNAAAATPASTNTGRKKAARKRSATSGASASSVEAEAAASSGRQIPDFPEFPDLVDVGDFIRQQREKMEMSVRRLSELAGVSNPYLSQIERGLRNPSADILQQVANALRISVETLYVRAGILPDQDRSVSTVPEAIEHDRELSEDQKTALLNVYQSFVSR